MPEKKLFAPRAYDIYAPRDLSKRWFVWYYEDGIRKKRYEGINQHDTARQRMKAAQDLIKKIKKEFKGRRVLSSTEKALNEYLEEQRPRWGTTTYEEYIGMNRQFCRYLNGREVNEALVRKYMVGLMDKYKAATWNKHRDRLRANLLGIGCIDYFEFMPPLKVNSSPAKYFQNHQAERLGRRIKEENEQLWLYVQFMFYTFIRPKELRGLRAGDILIDAGEIRVPAEISKNKKTQFVAIPDSLMPELKFIRAMAPGELIFPGRNGNQLGKNTMYKRHKRILDALNFGPEYTLYSWKHTGAITLFRRGVSIKEIQMQMRHHSLDQTDEYLRQLGARDVVHLRRAFPRLLELTKDEDEAA